MDIIDDIKDRLSIFRNLYDMRRIIEPIVNRIIKNSKERQDVELC